MKFAKADNKKTIAEIIFAYPFLLSAKAEMKSALADEQKVEAFLLSAIPFCVSATSSIVKILLKM